MLGMQVLYCTLPTSSRRHIFMLVVVKKKKEIVKVLYKENKNKVINK